MEVKEIILRETEVVYDNEGKSDLKIKEIARFKAGMEDKEIDFINCSLFRKNIGRVDSIYLSPNHVLLVDFKKNSNISFEKTTWNTINLVPASTPESITKLESENSLEEISK